MTAWIQVAISVYVECKGSNCVVLLGSEWII